MISLVQQIASEYKSKLQSLYGADFVELILFGSHARGDFHDESDIDFALVLRKPRLRPSEEVFKTSPISTELELKYGLMLSTLPVSLEKKQGSQQWVYQAIREEGIVI
jgi:predicted nucleotidyltransferase